MSAIGHVNIVEVDRAPKRKKLERLEEIEREEHEEHMRRELKRKLRLERLEAEAKAREEEEDEKERRKQYIADWKREEAEKKEKEKKKKEQEDREFEQKVKEKFLKAGYSVDHIEAILKEKREKKQEESLAVDVSRPTWIKVHRKYLHPETLEAYGLPWDFYEKDTNYVVIKKYISQSLQDELFEHTRTMKSKKLILAPEAPTGLIEKDTVTTLKVADSTHRDKDKMYLVRNKSQTRSKSRNRSGSAVDVKRRSWIFT
ncbi:putative myosin heavy [Phaeomoniella chlamydospora]|uniref:Putative myosin heavy n=1 Tax=Phaeomoniella chlamydospora TaxID=158046 RepID=A0A0G2HGK2_PHACM|nr:putative myosin heavy [Phaeomoniella chlamydospora]